MTGDDDPDDRRTMPVGRARAARPTPSLLAHYRALDRAARAAPTRCATATSASCSPTTPPGTRRLRPQDRRRRPRSSSLNRSDAAADASSSRSAASCRTGRRSPSAYEVGSARRVAGRDAIALGPMSGAVLVATGRRPAGAGGAASGCGSPPRATRRVGLAWDAVGRGRVVRRLPQPALGRRLGEGERRAAHRHDVHGHRPPQRAGRPLRRAGASTRPATQSAPSNEVTALPHLEIGWANLQWPPTLTHTISAVSTAPTTSTARSGSTASRTSAGPAASRSRRSSASAPTAATPPATPPGRGSTRRSTSTPGTTTSSSPRCCPTRSGTYDYAYRYSTTGGRDWVYADLDGIGNGYSPAQAGSADRRVERRTRPPRRCRPGSHVVSASPAGIELAWDAVAGDPTLYGYEVLAATPGGPYTVALVTGDVVHRPRRRARRDVQLRRALGRHVVQPLGAVGEVRDRGRRAPHGDASTFNAHRAGGDGRDGQVGVHRRHARPARRRPAGVEPGRRRRSRASTRRTGAIDPDRPRGDAARVQVRARRVGVRREGRRLRRDREPPAHAELRRERDAGGERHGTELAQRARPAATDFRTRPRTGD